MQTRRKQGQSLTQAESKINAINEERQRIIRSFPTLQTGLKKFVLILMAARLFLGVGWGTWRDLRRLQCSKEIAFPLLTIIFIQEISCDITLLHFQATGMLHFEPYERNNASISMLLYRSKNCGISFCSQISGAKCCGHDCLKTCKRSALFPGWGGGPFLKKSINGQFQKISIPNHGRLPCFNPPLPSEIPKCISPPCPQNSIIANPPSPSEFPVFLEVHFRLGHGSMNKRT